MLIVVEADGARKVCAMGLDLVGADVGLGEGAGGGGKQRAEGKEADVFAAGKSISGVSRDGALSVVVVSDAMELDTCQNESSIPEGDL